MKKVLIYGLSDPRNNETKYIGKTNNPKKRFSEHISEAKRGKTKKDNWIKKLIKLNLKPELFIIDEVLDSQIEYWEEYYIKYYKYQLKCELVNWDDCGVGTKDKIKTYSITGTNLRNQKIVQYNLSGEKIKEFSSLREATRCTGINHGNISKCCSGKYKHAGGFIFKKLNDTNIVNKVTKQNGKRKRVLELDLNGNIINEYISISEAAKKTNSDAANISRVCNGKLNKTNNKIFKFKNNE
jgi:predicted GIY-YIG superfamily endonuclease